jgi:transcriptional regulator with XRE-family HTH domain
MKHIKNTGLAKKFGMKVRIERIKMGISQEKLAEFADLSKCSIGAIERGESSPTLDTINSLAEVFKMKPCELLEIDKINL